MEPFVGHAAELASLRAELTLVGTPPRATGCWPASRLGSHPLTSPPRLAFGGKGREAMRHTITVVRNRLVAVGALLDALLRALGGVGEGAAVGRRPVSVDLGRGVSRRSQTPVDASAPSGNRNLSD